MYKLNEEKMFYDLADGQAIVINYVSGVYFGFSELGSVILDALIKGADDKAVLCAIQHTSECPADFEKTYGSFLRELEDREILITSPEAGKEADITVRGNDYTLSVNEYAEVQNLLLADPVHDVDVEMGWPVVKEDE